MSPIKARKTVAPQIHQRADKRDQAQPAHGDVRPRVAREPGKGAASRATKAKADSANGIVSPRVDRELNKGAKRVARERGAKAGGAELSHLDARGQARMVEISAKPITARTAIARAELRMLHETMRVLRSGRAAKGDVLAVARVAGIQAAKRTPELIPLCHAIALTKSEIAFQFSKNVLTVEARVSALDRTGAEMEALTAASIAALTVYDMLKAIDRGMTIERVALHEKQGGKTGTWRRSTGK